jgi:hypothetical protein
MTRRPTILVCFVCLLVVATSMLLFADPAAPVPAAGASADQWEASKNGIDVYDPSTYDVESFRAKLQSVADSISAFSFYDADKLKGAIGTMQGATENSSLTSFQAQIALPTISVTESRSIDKAPSQTSEQETAGSKEGGSQITKWTIDLQKQNSPPTAISKVDMPSHEPTLKPQVNGLQTSPQDLLSQQMQLTYQVVNLCTWLNGRLSGLHYIPKQKDEKAEKGFKMVDVRPLESLVGFHIGVTPKYKDAVAEVQVTLAPMNSAEASVVTLFPQQNTYNTIAYSRKATGFGIGALVQPISFGVGGESSKATMYFVRDTDVLAMQMPSASNGAARFGWQIRPVLGQRAVVAGPRDVFAMVSLSSFYTDDAVCQVTIDTHWRRYDRKTGIVGKIIEGSMAPVLSEKLVLPGTDSTDYQLAPRVVRTATHDLGNGAVMVDVTGTNFGPGTSITLGDKTYSTANSNLTVFNERNLQFQAPAATLAQQRPVLCSRHGSAEIVTEFSAPEGQATPQPLSMVECTATPKDDKIAAVAVTIKSARQLPQTLEGRKAIQYPPMQHPYIISVGPKVYGLSDSPMDLKLKGTNEFTASFDAETALLKDNPVALRMLTGDDSYSSCLRASFTPEVACPANVTLLGATGKLVQVGLSGSKLPKNVMFVLGDKSYSPKKSYQNLLVYYVSKPAWDAASAAVISMGPAGPCRIVDLKPLKPTTGK